MQGVIASNGTSTDPSGGVYCAMPCEDISTHADMAARFAVECSRRVGEAQEEASRHANMGVRDLLARGRCSAMFRYSLSYIDSPQH